MPAYPENVYHCGGRPLLCRTDPAMTVFIYVDTSKEVGDPDHLKVFANAEAADTWLEENEPEGVAFVRHQFEPGAGVAGL
jgi:hypothetical protein